MDQIIDGKTVLDIYLELCDTCDYGQNPELLNEYERTVFVTQELVNEVNNGGFMQFFDNSSGQFAGEIVETLLRIGAPKTAAICKKALSVFDQPLPADWEERRALLDEIGDEAGDVLGECDDAFYADEEDLVALNEAYIRDHIEMFTRTIDDL